MTKIAETDSGNNVLRRVLYRNAEALHGRRPPCGSIAGGA